MSMMRSEELAKFFEDVKRWNAETLPRLEALSDAWEQADYKDLQTGVELCGALQVARNFVQNADKFRVEVRLRKVAAYMRKIESQEQRRGHVDVVNKRTGILIKGVNHVAYVPEEQPLDENNVPKTLPPDAEQTARKQKVEPVKQKVEQTASESGIKFAVPRPKHYDEWMDKMSPELREDVEQLSYYYAELAAADEIMRSLYNNKMASHQDLSTAAKRVHAWDKKILAIFYRADVEWAELTGQTAMLEDPDKKYFEKAEKDANKLLGIAPKECVKNVTTPTEENAEKTTDAEAESAKNVTTDAQEGVKNVTTEAAETTEEKVVKPKRTRKPRTKKAAE